MKPAVHGKSNHYDTTFRCSGLADHTAPCTLVCYLPEAILVHKHVPGASAQGPYQHDIQVSVYERLDMLSTFMASEHLPAPTILVINCLWWDLAHHVLAADNIHLTVFSYQGHSHLTFLDAEAVETYYQDVTKLVMHISKQFNISQQHLLLHTSFPGQNVELVPNIAASQLNAAVRQVALHLGTSLLDLDLLLHGLPEGLRLRDTLHQQPWISKHTYRLILRCLNTLMLQNEMVKR